EGYELNRDEIYSLAAREIQAEISEEKRQTVEKISTYGIGLFIYTVSKTRQQAMMTNFSFIPPFFMLSGFVFPIANMPIVVQWLPYQSTQKRSPTCSKKFYIQPIFLMWRAKRWTTSNSSKKREARKW
ncbi:MAG: ABC transporter permease, partial [Desulfobacterales bacterium]